MIHVTFTKTFDEGNFKAFANVEADGILLLNGCRIMNGENGYFLKMPTFSYKDKDGKMCYKEMVKILNEEFRRLIELTTISEYKKMLEFEQDKNPSEIFEKEIEQLGKYIDPARELDKVEEDEEKESEDIVQFS